MGILHHPMSISTANARNPIALSLTRIKTDVAQTTRCRTAPD